MLGGKGKVQFDSTDLQILKEISKNAAMSLLDLSGKIGKTAEALAYRLKRLEKVGLIQGYRATIDFAKLGYEFYKAEIRLSRYQDIDAIVEYCHRHSNIYQIDRTIGGETFEMEFHVKDLQEMLAIIAEFERVFPKTIERFDYLTVLGIEKITYMPEILEK